MRGKVVALAGQTGSGKTTFVKNMTANSKKNIFAYVRIEKDFKRGKVFTNFMDFLKVTSQKSNSIFFIDEAFTCLPKTLSARPDKPNSVDNLIIDLLVNARKLNNFIFIVYHSLSQVPTQWLIPYLDYFVRFNTQDMLQFQKTRFSSFPQIYNSLETYPEIPKLSCDEIKMR